MYHLWTERVVINVRTCKHVLSSYTITLFGENPINSKGCNRLIL